MGSGFFGLDIAIRGLYSAQRQLDVVNNNINNINTPGYSRQVAVQVATTPLALNDGTGMMGTGSEVIAVNRVRDEYLDYKYWSEQCTYGENKIKSELLADIEATFNEPSNSGFTQMLNEFYNALQELSKDPSSEATRTLVKQKGITVAKYFNNTATHFEKLQADINYRINTVVTEINSLANQITKLNRQIYTIELNGTIANELRDQRTVLVDKLSSLVDITANEVTVGTLPNGQEDKHFVITIGGKTLVNHFDYTKLVLNQRNDKLNPEDIANLYEVSWEDGNELIINSGELKGYLDVRDGNLGQNGSPNYAGIPYYISKLNEFARTFAMAFNEGFIDADRNGLIEDDKGENVLGHADGYKLNSTGGETEPAGIRFFTYIGDDGAAVDSLTFIGGATSKADIREKYKKITAANLAVGMDVINDINNICTSGQAGKIENTDIISSLIDLRDNSHMFAEGKPEDFMKSLVAFLGIDSQQAKRMAESQDNIIKLIENSRLSISGVSIDEEMVNMIKSHQVYAASAKMITTMDEVYEILINKVGKW